MLHIVRDTPGSNAQLLQLNGPSLEQLSEQVPSHFLGRNLDQILVLFLFNFLTFVLEAVRVPVVLVTVILHRSSSVASVVGDIVQENGAFWTVNCPCVRTLTGFARHLVLSNVGFKFCFRYDDLLVLVNVFLKPSFLLRLTELL